ncbi:GntR family transcriptional regulator [Enterobacter cloacae]|uniref:GntR family transcriptional regulator n=1 Tax=Enterobacter cloacae TaxID=550 RepID=UPI0015F922D5|nr:GntR family transcriptional regulator [Enterobacter cloacae]MBA7852577.1 GntR family transcriptional regulator [Enterobacter cloacae]MDT8891118.1 GntR family transcriptional regulator [Enterobacter cloacae]
MPEKETFNRIEKNSLTQQVESRLKDALLSGALKPGRRLIAQEIAEGLGTSLTPVREALMRLSSYDVVQASFSRSFIVPEVKLDYLDDLLLMCRDLEAHVIASVCMHISNIQIKELNELSELFSESVKAENVQNALKTNRLIRFKLYRIADKPVVREFLLQVWLRLGPYYNFIYEGHSGMFTSPSRFHRLLFALEKRDIEASQSAIALLLGESETLLQKQFVHK